MHTATILSSLALTLGLSTSVLAQVPGPTAGEVKLALPGGGMYIGTATNGVPDGKGYFQDADGLQYEGEVRMGQRTGLAEALFPNKDSYQGEWKDGKPHGKGTMTYMLGGSYEGSWNQGVRDGRGTMRFAGSGRRAEVGFMNGQRIDSAPPVPEQDVPKQRYALHESSPPVGSHLANKISSSAIPPNAGWEKLTAAQQRIVRDRYPALDDADEPPYPLKGPGSFYSKVAELTGKYQINEEVRIFVLVGTDGKAASVTTIGLDDPEARRLAGTLAGMVPYKPARCGGQPCQMMFPFDLRLSTRY